MPADPQAGMVENVATPEGRELGALLAGFADGVLGGRADNRCGTCAFRSGDHVANGSAATLMNALKSVLEGGVFACHEHDRPCAGWAALRAESGAPLQAPWSYVEGSDDHGARTYAA